MKKSPILIGLVLLSFSISGCEALSFLPFIGGGTEDTEEDFAVAPATLPAGTTPANPDGTDVPAGENAGEPGFEDPVIEGEDAELPTPDGLIPVTSRDAAVKILQQNQGRQNPFATIPVQLPNAVSSVLRATVQQNTTREQNASGENVSKLPTPSLPRIPKTPALPRARQRPAPFVPPKPQAPPQATPQPKPQATPQPKPQAPPQATPQAPSNTPPLGPTGEGAKPGAEIPEFNPDELPSLPEPTIAKGFTVTGVVNLGGTTKAIVQDGEGKSQYVSPGEYLGSGQVLVKRIEMNRGSRPVVIFEELGIEVIRAVGAPPADNNA